ncbi:MAG TPA: glycoside hydrolase family 95 protein, partial [Candidatus Acidoferrales bacterium]|nr:glycoside hydrolase family 95 protein [Candidatus Acidoferrales bacterium]
MPTLPCIFFTAFAALSILHPSARAAEPASPLTLYYTSAATKWTEALPIGNGRLGAMIFGGAEREHLQLNEGTLWAGGPYDPNNTNALAALPDARQLIFDGKYDDAFTVVSQKMMAVPVREMPYETLGDLYLDFPVNLPVYDYRRDLNLDTAVASVSYTANGVHFKREIFASAVDQVIVIRLTADKPGQIAFTAGMATPQKTDVGVELNGRLPFLGMTNGASLVMNGTNGEAHGIKGALKFQARVCVLPSQGKIFPEQDKIIVAGADSVTLLVAAATSYKNYHDVTGNPQ